MKITEDTVRQVGKLARLAVSTEEAEKLAPQLNDILGYAEQLQAVDLADVPPTSHPFALSNVMREDINRPSMDRELILGNAPDSDGEQVRVPAVMEG